MDKSDGSEATRSVGVAHFDVPGESAPLADYLERVAGLAPLILENAAAADRDRRLPAPLVEALHGNGFYRMLLPGEFGGAQLSPPVFAQVIEALARHDASTAWCICQANGCAMIPAYLDAPIARQIWDGPGAVLAWGPATKILTVPEGDGFRVTADFSFASGSRQASWLGGHTPITGADGKWLEDADGRPVIRTLLFPVQAAEMRDVWDVIGLRGTGSDSYSIADLLVPGSQAPRFGHAADRRSNAPLYQFPAMSLFAAGFAGTAMGIARSMLEDFKALSLAKRPRMAQKTLNENGMVQAEFGAVEAGLAAARAYLFGELIDIWGRVKTDGVLSIDDRMRIRLAATHAIHQAKGAAETVYDLAGATAIFAGGPYERRYRDIRTVTQQLQGRKDHIRTVGAYLLGEDPELAVI